jgi:hypothetical protein
MNSGIFLYAKIHSGDSYLMPTLNWIGKDAVVDHQKHVPFRLPAHISIPHRHWEKAL